MGLQVVVLVEQLWAGVHEQWFRVTGKGNGNYYLGFRVQGSYVVIFRVCYGFSVRYHNILPKNRTTWEVLGIGFTACS